MRSIRLVAVILAVLVGLSSCSRDPNVVKKHYLESGNKYFDKGRYKEASIQYRNALKRDQKYGAAYYKLALVSLRVGDTGGAASALRRAVELIPKDQPDYWDATVKLSATSTSIRAFIKRLPSNIATRSNAIRNMGRRTTNLLW